MATSAAAPKDWDDRARTSLRTPPTKPSTKLARSPTCSPVASPDKQRPKQELVHAQLDTIFSEEPIDSTPPSSPSPRLPDPAPVVHRLPAEWSQGVALPAAAIELAKQGAKGWREACRGHGLHHDATQGLAKAANEGKKYRSQQKLRANQQTQQKLRSALEAEKKDTVALEKKHKQLAKQHCVSEEELMYTLYPDKVKQEKKVRKKQQQQQQQQKAAATHEEEKDGASPRSRAIRKAVDTEQKKGKLLKHAGNQGEDSVAQQLLSVGLGPESYRTDEQLTASQAESSGRAVCTPDFLFTHPSGIRFDGLGSNQNVVHWIEVKAGFVVPKLSPPYKPNKIKKQLERNVKTYGPGLVVWADALVDPQLLDEWLGPAISASVTHVAGATATRRVAVTAHKTSVEESAASVPADRKICKHVTMPTSSDKQCAGCSKQLPTSSFSKNQLSRGPNALCKDCVKPSVVSHACDLCGICCNSPKMLQQHLQGQKHKAMEEKRRKEAVKIHKDKATTKQKMAASSRATEQRQRMPPSMLAVSQSTKTSSQLVNQNMCQRGILLEEFSTDEALPQAQTDLLELWHANELLWLWMEHHGQQ